MVQTRKRRRLSGHSLSVNLSSSCWKHTCHSSKTPRISRTSLSPNSCIWGRLPLISYQPSVHPAEQLRSARDTESNVQYRHKEAHMPEKRTIKRARKDAREGKAPSTQAGEFVREEMDHIREGKHGARSAKQAIAIGLSKARRAGVKLPPPKKGTASEKTRNQAARNYEQGQTSPGRKPSPTRSRAITRAMKREGTQAASHTALSRQAHASARSRGAANRRQAARKAARTRSRSR